MFAEEKPFLLPLPVEPFRYYQYGERIVHLDGCVEVEAAYYGAPPGWIGRVLRVQWDELYVRLLDPKTGQLLREHVRQKRGWYRIKEEDHPKRTPLRTSQLLWRAGRAGSHIGTLCDAIHRQQGEVGVRRILGVLSLAKKYGTAAVDEACAAALDMGVQEYRFVRRYLERCPQAPLSLQQVDPLAPIDLLSCLVSDELARRGERLLERRTKQAQFRDSHKTLDNFDFTFNKKMNRSLVFDLATGAFIARHEDALFLGPPGTGKSHLAQAIGQAAIQQGYRVLYRETHKLLDDLAEATIDGTRKEHMELLASVPLLIIDDLGMRKLPVTAAEELLEIVMRRYERTSTLLTSNRPVEDWGKLLGDSAAVTAMLDRLLHHGHVLKCGPRSWRTKIDLPPQEAAG